MPRGQQGQALERLCLQKPVTLFRLLRQASHHYLAALAMDDIPLAEKRIPGVTSWATHERLVIVSLQLQDLHQAKQCLQVLQKQRPNTLRTQLSVLEYTIQQKAYGNAFQLAQPLMKQIYPDSWVLASQIVLKMGLYDEARTFCQEALSRTKNKFVEAHRMRLLTEVIETLKGVSGNN